MKNHKQQQQQQQMMQPGVAAAEKVAAMANNTTPMQQQVDMDTMNKIVLKLLNQLEIKFPGKTSQQSRLILAKVNAKFEEYKPKLANYWMVKLDDAKRAKVNKYDDK